MRRVEDGEPLHHVGMVHRDRPRDAPAPIVADEECRIGAELADEAADVVGEQVDAVGLEPLWLRRQVVATGVGRYYAKPSRRERLDLPAPAEPELREPVQQN